MRPWATFRDRLSGAAGAVDVMGADGVFAAGIIIFNLSLMAVAKTVTAAGMWFCNIEDRFNRENG